MLRAPSGFTWDLVRGRALHSCVFPLLVTGLAWKRCICTRPVRVPDHPGVVSSWSYSLHCGIPNFSEAPWLASPSNASLGHYPVVTIDCAIACLQHLSVESPTSGLRVFCPEWLASISRTTDCEKPLVQFLFAHLLPTLVSPPSRTMSESPSVTAARIERPSDDQDTRRAMNVARSPKSVI
jgi:hypothetical protein